MAIVLVPIGWTILFATAGALTLDATSFTARRRWRYLGISRPRSPG